jgi:hypothetical protein
MKRIVLTIVISLAATAYLLPPAFGISYNPELFTIAEKGGGSMGMKIAGNFVLWQDSMQMGWKGYDLARRESFTITSGNAMTMISNEFYAVWRDESVMTWYAYDLAARRKFSLGITDADTMSVRLTENYLIYRDMMDMILHGVDLKTGEIFDITTAEIDSMSVQAGGHFTVWRTMALPVTLMGYDLAARQLFLISDAEMIDSMGLTMSDQFVAWREGMVPSPSAGLYGFDLAHREKFLITTTDIDSMSLRAAGQYIVGRAMYGGGLYGFDGVAREIFEMTTGYIDTMSLVLNEGYAVWRDNAKMYINGFEFATRRLIETGVQMMYTPALGKNIFFWNFNSPETMVNEIHGFDLATGIEFLVSPKYGASGTSTPIAGGDYVVWSDMIPPSADTGLFGARIWMVPNETCGEAVEVAAGVPYAGDTTFAQGTDQSSCGFEDWRDVWFAFKPAVGGDYTIDAHSDAFDTTLAAFPACTGAETACSDDASLQTSDSRLVMTLTKGKRYLFRVAGYDGSGGPYTFTVSRGSCKTPPTADLNGDCKVNLSDLAILSSQWLRCGLDPVILCTQ